MVAHAPTYSSLDLPCPLRSTWPLLALAGCALAFEADRRLPWQAGLSAAAAFVVAAGLRAWRAHRELQAVRRAADRLIVRAPHGKDASELVLWRSRELTGREARAALQHEIRRTIRQLDAGRLPSSSPLRRVPARRHSDLLCALAARIGDERPVAARGIVLARDLVREPTSPLYAEGADAVLARTLSRVLGALEP
jgi:hypothetical protein